MIDQHLVEKKLRRIEKFLREIVSAEAPPNFDAFAANIIFKRFVERNIELAIEQMIDVCKHFIASLNLQEPETYSDCFVILGKSDILPNKSIDMFKSMARYRNLLIHAYDGVDDTITYSIYKKHLNDFGVFVSSIRQYIDGE